MSLEQLDDDEVIALHFSAPAVGEELACWCNGGLVGDTVTVPVGSGMDTAAVGDWIVRDAQGAFTVMGPDDFTVHYVSVAG